MQNTGGNPSIAVFDNVSFAFPGGDRVFDGTTFEIPRGSIVSVAGESGSGKTTLGFLLKGIIPHAMKGSFDGRVTVDGIETRGSSISRIARVAGMLFQNLDAQIFSSSVIDEIQFGLKNLKMDLVLAKDAINRLGIEHLEKRNPLNLSAGQKQRVLLAATIAPRPKLLILDEPTAHLDREGRDGLARWLVDLNRELGTTVVIFDQDPQLAGEICTAHFAIKQKRVLPARKEDLLEQGPCWRWKRAGS